MVFAFGAIYSLLTPSDNGLEHHKLKEHDLSWWHGLYFSIVTASSLGYGDFTPKGLSKVLSNIEVVTGLFLIGAIVASYTSRQATRIVSKTLTMNIEDKLNSFSKYFIEYDSKIRHQGYTMLDIVDSNASVSTVSDKASETRLQLRQLLMQLSAISLEFRNYVMKEDDKSLFFDIIPNTTLFTLMSSIRDILIAINNTVNLYHRIESDFDIQQIMESRNREYTIECVSNIMFILGKFSKYIDSKDVLAIIYSAERICESILRSTSDTPRDSESIEDDEFDVPQE